MLDDHELMQRMHKLGPLVLSRRFLVHAVRPPRRQRPCRWTLVERLLYHVTPFRMKDWFFYDFLWRRFQLRGMGTANLRVRDWGRARLSRRRPTRCETMGCAGWV